MTDAKVTVARPRILVLDIETMPATVVTFSTFKPFIGINQIKSPTTMGMFAYKWHGADRVGALSTHVEGHEAMIGGAANLLDQADIVVTYNGVNFDIPHLKREILEAGLTPPSPWKNVDLYQVVKRNFRFQSNKLDYVCQQLGIGEKVSTGGMDLWLACMEGDPRAWRKMIRYCKQDVRITDNLYTLLLPWITTHPNANLWSDSTVPACPRCAGNDLEKRGQHHAISQSYQQYRCRTCGAWSRGLPILKRAGETRAV